MPINPDKIVILDKPFFTPGTDIYDRDTEGPVIQLGVTLQRFTGDLHMKVEHFKYIAGEKLGMYSAEYVERMLEVNEELREQNIKLKQDLNRAREEEQNGFNERLDRLFANYSNGSEPYDDTPPVASTEISYDAGADSLFGEKPKGKTKDSDLDN